uniref:Uncharacterized protein n=1 Tax=viral metagenome TaxID=1070528 RepID=A0A6M3K5X4_9ZZZZ
MEKEKIENIMKAQHVKKARMAFSEILKKIDSYHEKFDKILVGTTDVDKAFIFATYIWKLRGDNEVKNNVEKTG